MVDILTLFANTSSLEALLFLHYSSFCAVGLRESYQSHVPMITKEMKHLNQVEPFTVFYSLTTKGWYLAMTQTRPVISYNNIFVMGRRRSLFTIVAKLRECGPWSSYAPTADQSLAETNKTSYIWGERANENNVDVSEIRIYLWNSLFSELMDFLFA